MENNPLERSGGGGADLTEIVAREPVFLFPLSAPSADELKAKASAYADWIEGAGAGAPLRDLCYSAGVSQAGEDHRLAIVFQTRHDLASRLRSFVEGGTKSRIWAGARDAKRPVKAAFVFCGQGAQWWAMARLLLETSPVFRAVVEECDGFLKPHAGWSLLAELRADEAASRIGQTEIVQPVMFAVQAGLAAHWRALGVEPAAVVGHSLGEIAAAHVCGALSLKESVRLAYHRGRIMQRATGRGRMAAVALSLEKARQAIEPYAGRVCVGASNSPVSTVLSGDTDALTSLVAELEAASVTVRWLKVDYAFHSHQMEPFLPELEAALGSVETRRPAIPAYSTVLASRVGRRDEDFTSDYWKRNVRQPVLFRETVAAMIKDGFNTFLEIGPHPVLWVDISHCLQDADVEGTALSSLRRGEDDEEQLLSSLGTLYTKGFEPDWPKVYPAANVTALPANEAGRPAAADPLGRWFHQVRWDLKPISGSEAWRIENTYAAGRWLIFADSSESSRTLLRLRDESSQPSVIALRGTAYADLGEGRFKIDPNSRADFRQLLEQTVIGQRRRCPRIVYLWGLDAGEPGSQGADEAVSGLLHLVQELARAGLRDAPQIWIVTKGVRSLEGDKGSLAPVAQAPLWGLGRTIMHEHPSLRCSMADLGSDAASPEGEQEISSLLRLVSSEITENQIGLRGPKVYIPRLHTISLPAAGTSSGGLFGERGTYLVTGGFGSIGLRVAHWMAAHGARRLRLLGRGSPSAQSLASIELIRQTGARVDLMAFPTGPADREGVRQAFMDSEKDGAPIAGVMHCAGMLDEASLLQQSPERLRQAMRSRLLGAWNLHLASEGRPLDFLVMFSSVFAVLGAPGQAAFAAADCFMDALARSRRRLGLPAVSVRWGPWHVGRWGRLTPQASQGLTQAEPDMALAALERVLQAGAPPNVLATPFNVRQWTQSYLKLAELPMLSEMMARQNGAAAAKMSRSPRARIDSAKPEAKGELLRQHVRDTVADILARPSSQISPDAPLDQLGLTSLNALELRNQLEETLAVKLPATLAWGGHPTIGHFVKYLAARMNIPILEDSRVDPELMRVFEALKAIPD